VSFFRSGNAGRRDPASEVLCHASSSGRMRMLHGSFITHVMPALDYAACYPHLWKWSVFRHVFGNKEDRGPRKSHKPEEEGIACSGRCLKRALIQFVAVFGDAGCRRIFAQVSRGDHPAWFGSVLSAPSSKPGSTAMKPRPCTGAAVSAISSINATGCMNSSLKQG
jgi:hypothetical protein